MVLWRWFDVYLVAPDRVQAVLVLRGHLQDTLDQDEPVDTEAVGRRVYDEPGAAYDALLLEDYLHAVPPNDVVELPGHSLPSSGPGDIVPWSTGADEQSQYVTTYGSAEASKWAQLLPAGTVVDLTA